MFSLWKAYLGNLDSHIKLGIIVALFFLGLAFQEVGHSFFESSFVLMESEGRN